MRDFCIELVEKTVEERENNNQIRKDLIQYLIQLRNNQKANGVDEWSVKKLGRLTQPLNDIRIT